MKKSLKISEIKKRFKKEWLLIAVDKMDSKKGSPLTGTVVFHSPDFQDLAAAAKKTKYSHLMSIYSEDWPEDLAACFYVQLSA